MMKHAGLFLVMFVLCLIFVSALGDGAPYEIESYLDQRYPGNEIMGFINPGSSLDGFAAISHEGRNKLVVFRYNNGYWNYQWTRNDPLPQDGDIILFDLSGAYYNGLRLNTAFCIRQSEYGSGGYETVWEQSGSHWRLRAVFYVNEGGIPQDSFYVEANGIRYNGWESNYTNVYVDGTVQTDLQYFVFSVFPKSISAMRKKISSAPVIPAGTLNAQNIHFDGGQKYDVYSGPGEEYVRGGNGKAMVSTNDWIQVFGEERGWILIQYNISNGHMRFGYIPAISLPRNARVSPFNFNHIPSMTTRYVQLTDDPLNSQAVLYSIPAGARVDWLSVMGNWAYVEYRGDWPVRGFIPMDALTPSGQ